MHGRFMVRMDLWVDSCIAIALAASPLGSPVYTAAGCVYTRVCFPTWATRTINDSNLLWVTDNNNVV